MNPRCCELPLAAAYGDEPVLSLVLPADGLRHTPAVGSAVDFAASRVESSLDSARERLDAVAK
jgi:hypothetical protein